MQRILDRVLSLVLLITAIAITGTLVRRELGGEPSVRPRAGYVADWAKSLQVGRSMGRTDAPITIVEFSDFECTFCKQFHSTMNSLKQRYPATIHHAFVHFPLDGHRNALRAAKSAECAAQVGALESAIALLFQHQDSLGNLEWPWFIEGLQSENRMAVQTCMSDTARMAILDEGMELGRQMGVRGTPTVILNGWRYPGMPSDSELTRAVSDLLSGKPPYNDYPIEAMAVSGIRGSN